MQRAIHVDRMYERMRKKERERERERERESSVTMR